MRRNDREITDRNKIYEIMENCACCRLGFYDDGEVYIVPLNFGYDRTEQNTVLYFHGAKAGRKLDLINKVQSVGFEMDTEYKLKQGKTACAYSAEFQSIIGTGAISVIDDPQERETALQSIMRHLSGKGDWQFTDAMLDSVSVFKVVVHKLSCKCHQ